VSSRLLGLSHRVGYAAFLSLISGVAALFPLQGDSLDTLYRLLTFLDVPVSAVGRLFPLQWRGMWLFWPDPDILCRGVAPDTGRMLLNQVLIGTPTYVAVFYFPNLAYAAFQRIRRRRGPATQEPAP
jgi:hypothetical protein